MKISLKTAKILALLKSSESVANSRAKGKLFNRLVEENILYRKGRHRQTLHLLNAQELDDFLANQLQIKDLEGFIRMIESEEATRADFVKITTDSKHSKERAFKGFLVNTIGPIQAVLNQKSIQINPPIGSFQFISDYENFEIPEDIIVVGVENARNFSLIHQQQYLFKTGKYLFISRYPQSQHTDVIRWLKSISNVYLHFGDFDLAGIGIFLNECQKHLADRASFFIPKNIEETITSFGNRKRYNLQRQNFSEADIRDERLLALLKTIHQTRKGLDQEYFISGEEKTETMN